MSEKSNKVIKLNRSFNRVGVINSTTASKLKDKNKDYYFRDTNLKGFFIRVRDGGTKTYGVRVRELGVGRLKSISIGSCNKYTAKAARTKATELITQISQGVNPQLAKEKAKLESHTITEMLDSFISLKDRSKRTVNDYRNKLNNVLSVFANKPIKDITAIEIATWYRQGSNKPRATDIGFSVLKNCFNQAVALDVVDANDNPIPKVESLISRYKSPPKETTLKDDVLGDFLNALLHLGKENKLPDVAKDWILFKLATGTRSNELSNLKWNNIDLVKGTYTFYQTKTGQPLTQAITPLTNNILDNRAVRQRVDGIESDFVFNGRGQDGYFKDARKTIAKIKQHANTNSAFSAHDFRNAFIILAEQKAKVLLGTTKNHDGTVNLQYESISTQDIKALVNHKKDITRRYSSADIEKMSKQLWAIHCEINKSIVDEDGKRYIGLFEWLWYEDESWLNEVSKDIVEQDPLESIRSNALIEKTKSS